MVTLILKLQTYRPFYNSNFFKPNKLASFFEKNLAYQMFCKLSNFYQIFESLT